MNKEDANEQLLIAEMEFHFGSEGSGCHISPKHVRAFLSDRSALRERAEAWKRLSITVIAAENASVLEYVKQVEDQRDAAVAALEEFASTIHADSEALPPSFGRGETFDTKSQ